MPRSSGAAACALCLLLLSFAAHAETPPESPWAARLGSNSAFQQLRRWALGNPPEALPEAGPATPRAHPSGAPPAPAAPTAVPVPGASGIPQAVVDAFRSLLAPGALASDVAQAASPAFEGRGIGTPGGTAYRAVLQDRLRRSGLQVDTQAFRIPPLLDWPFGGRRLDSIFKSASGANVLAWLPGSDPRGEVVILSAHFDHLVPTRDLAHWAGLAGFATLPIDFAPLAIRLPLQLILQNILLRDLALDLFTGRLAPMPGVRKIFPGADDNASGTAALLEIADALGSVARGGERPRRTVMLCFFDGEEVGLKGSKAFIDSLSPEQRQRIVQVINLDMVGWSPWDHPDRVDVLVPPTLPLLVQALAGPGLKPLEGPEFMERHNPELRRRLEALNERLGTRLELHYTNHEFYGSDHYNFFMMRRPDGTHASTVMFYDGGDGPYHREGDRAAPGRGTVRGIDGAYAARVARLAAALAWDVANSDAPPEYVP